MDPDDVETIIDVNLKGTLYTARFTLPYLIESKGDFVVTGIGGGLRVPRRGGLQRLEVRADRLHAVASTTSCVRWACA